MALNLPRKAYILGNISLKKYLSFSGTEFAAELKKVDDNRQEETEMWTYLNLRPMTTISEAGKLSYGG